MENDILDALQDIGYEGPLKEEIGLAKALEGGPKSTEFTKLVAEVCGELRSLCGFEEMVNETKDSDEASSFLLELSSFLKEMGCPYIAMVTGHMSSRLQSRDDRMLLLDYLLSELMAARMIKIQNPQDKMDMEITIHESPMAKDLKDILMALGVNKPPPNISAEMLFSKIEEKLKELIQQKGPSVVGRPLFNKAIAPKQWSDLETYFTAVYDEFKMRREMLITRLDCTITSFEWSDRTRAKREQIQKAYQPFRETMKTRPDVKFSDFLAARDTLLHVEKTSSANVRTHTRCEVNKVIIGRVPDRGGRPSEQEPPPPEMPPWKQQAQGRGGRGGGFGGRGGGGGRPAERGGRGGGSGRVQGGWNNQSQNGQSNRNQDRGGYNRGGQSQSYPGANNSYQSQGYQQPSQGYQSNQSYQSQSSGYQSSGHNQGFNLGYSSGGQSDSYQSQSQPYQGQTQGYQHQGQRGYRNEHDDRMDTSPGQARTSGRSSYNRGGRY